MDNLYIGADAREKIMKGIQKASDAVSVTLGTAGQNSLIEALERPNFFATNDGYTILNSIRFSDPLEDLGRKILCEAVNKANRAGGDGSSTTCVLTAAILVEGMKHIGEASPMDIKRSLEDCIPLIEASIKAQTKEITVNDVSQVAAVSAEDQGIGDMIQEIYQKIGKEGVIAWDVSKTPKDSYSIGTGLTINGATYVSRYMCDIDPARGWLTTATLKNPKILLTKQKITSTNDIDKLGEQLYNQEIKELVIFTDEIEAPVVNMLVEIRAKTGIRIIVIKMPVLWNDEWWEDLEIATGARIVGPSTGIKLRDATVAHLGTVENLRITAEDTFIDGIHDMGKQILALQVGGTDAELIRAARLNTKTARYFVGAQSESSLAYRRLKVEDAINAASCALEGGIVAGGGVALVNATLGLDKSIGASILKSALKKPMQQIITNARPDFAQETIASTGKYSGFNSKTGKVEDDMFKAGIVDPADVVLNAVRNAIGVAASILTVGTVVLLPHEDKSQMRSVQ